MNIIKKSMNIINFIPQANYKNSDPLDPRNVKSIRCGLKMNSMPCGCVVLWNV